MKILVINCGSSSLKYQLIDNETEEVLAKGLCERIGIDGRLTHCVSGKDKMVLEVAMADHKAAVKLVLDKLVDSTDGVLSSLSEIDAVGHRIVHGGEFFNKSVVIDDDVIAKITECNDLAPLHNPANLIGIAACKTLMPNTPMVAVFDTAFHQSMPPEAYLYGIPYKYYEDYKIRRYGFHGTSHSFVSKRMAEILGKPIEDTKMIICHLGNGASICAVDGGKSIDTSMGLTPLDGLVMGTRSGSIDPAIVEVLCNKLYKSTGEVINVLNKESGIYGMSGVSSDFRDLVDAVGTGNAKAKIALDVFCYKVIKFIGSYVAAMGGVDAIVFTAGIGENNIEVRELICDKLGYLGAYLDKEANNIRGEEREISTPESRVKLYVVPTNEELAIAKETVALVK